jgi:RimJ/RimL family protein N-acetyltransferase
MEQMTSSFTSQQFAPLQGRHIRLEPLTLAHADGLVAASSGDPELYRWSAVPRGKDAVVRYIDTALAWRAAGTGLAFATLRQSDGVVIGSTRFFDIEHWTWPAGHERQGRTQPDVLEIGYTWLGHDSIRTGANTEAKALMLTHAFEVWGVLRVCLHTDVRNLRSQAAMERIGAKRDGTLRSHRMATDITPRDSARYSIVASEWPEVKRHLAALLDRKA